MSDKKGRSIEKEYRYTPRLELFADIGRKIDFALSGGRELAHMTFTKRSEKQSIAKPTSVTHLNRTSVGAVIVLLNGQPNHDVRRT